MRLDIERVASGLTTASTAARLSAYRFSFWARWCESRQTKSSIDRRVLSTTPLAFAQTFSRSPIAVSSSQARVIGEFSSASVSRQRRADPSWLTRGSLRSLSSGTANGSLSIAILRAFLAWDGGHR